MTEKRELLELHKSITAPFIMNKQNALSLALTDVITGKPFNPRMEFDNAKYDLNVTIRDGYNRIKKALLEKKNSGIGLTDDEKDKLIQAEYVLTAINSFNYELALHLFPESRVCGKADSYEAMKYQIKNYTKKFVETKIIRTYDLKLFEANIMATMLSLNYTAKEIQDYLNVFFYNLNKNAHRFPVIVASIINNSIAFKEMKFVKNEKELSEIISFHANLFSRLIDGNTDDISPLPIDKIV